MLNPVFICGLVLVPSNSFIPCFNMKILFTLLPQEAAVSLSSLSFEVFSLSGG